MLQGSSVYDPDCKTDFCVHALTGKCPKISLCIQESHGYCLTGQYEKDLIEYQLAQERERRYKFCLFKLTIDPMCLSDREVDYYCNYGD